MAYIYLKELKEILPEILDQWIYKDDESWEWIFQEIEQNCHVGKRLKGKKWQKNIIDDINKLYDKHKKEIETINKELTACKQKISNLSDQYTSKVQQMAREITEAKSMAQTAKDRTQIDYTKPYPSDADIAQLLYNRMVNRGATKDECDAFREVIHKYNATSTKWEEKNDG